MDGQIGNETALAVVEKMCSCCGISQPIEAFRYHDKESGRRHSQCNSCLAEYQRARRLGQRRQELKDYLDQASDASNPANYGTTTRTEAVVRGMMARFGGLEKFSLFWFEFLQHSRDTGKDHLVQRSLETLARLVEVTDRNRSDQPSAESESDTHETLKQYLLKTLFDDPEMGIAALEEMGFRVERPEDSTEQDSFGPFAHRVESRISDTGVGTQ